MSQKRSMLVILDGWGKGPNPEVDAIAQAKTPFVDGLIQKYPNSELITYGEEVGLPDGQMGNSEVGHLNIGAGRIVYQELARINKAIRERTLHQNEKLLKALSNAKASGKAIHLMGLVSDGGVHSHINHLKALVDICEEQKAGPVYIHAFTDGRDCDPKSGATFIEELLNHIENTNTKLATVTGRYYAMDRDKRWERIQLAYDVMVKGAGTLTSNVLENIQESYANDVTDEFLKPMVCDNGSGAPTATIQDGDTLICFNFRTDRPREISIVLTQEDMPDYGMNKLDLNYVTMTKYDETYKGVEVLFEKDNITNTMGEVLANAGKTQVRIAETEKYPHVTFFFSGGRESEQPGERRLLVASPKVATYDLKPEMSAYGITDAITEDIRSNQPDFICLNYANTDMVGHTGDFEAAKKAAETVDGCMKTLVGTALEFDYEIIVIADHGNSDYMINNNGTPNTAHTKNPVPCIYVSNEVGDKQLKDGKLADVAPTLLYLMELEAPTEMDGNILIS
ncbi:MAG: 2,3-bisphosphoglycerate-independent phosphoglycerate mutase [Bacteroidota bacterium]